MKKIIYLIIAGSVIMATSCKKFLETSPQGLLTSTELQTVAGIDGLVNMGYSSLDTHFDGQWPDFFHPISNWSFGDARSDDAYKGGGGTGDIFEFHQLEIGDVSATNAMLYSKWKADFTGINNINTAIIALNVIPLTTYPNKNIRLAEMKVLRSYFYLDLKKHFYVFPWIDETVSNDNYGKVGNTLTSDQLWVKIESDFSSAASVLPAKQADLSRVTKFAALAFLTKTYIFEGKWSLAAQTADQIISSNQYGLMQNFEQVYSLPEFEHGPEFIFSVAMSVRDGSPSGNLNWGDLLNAPVAPTVYGGGDGFNRPSQNLVNAFKVDANGLPLFDSYNNSDFIPSDNVTPVDPRLDFAIGRPGIPWKDYKGGVEDSSWARNLVVYGPYCKKKNIISPNSSLRATSGFPWALGALDYPLIKYTDVLLWKAEADIQMNTNLEEARTLINQIRIRAKNAPYVQKLTGGNAANYQIGLYSTAGWTQTYALKALQWERRLELCLEGQRFYDLARWGIADQVINKYFQTESVKRQFLTGANFIKNKHEYLPIPQSEIDRSQGIYKQNQFY